MPAGNLGPSQPPMNAAAVHYGETILESLGTAADLAGHLPLIYLEGEAAEQRAEVMAAVERLQRACEALVAASTR